MPTFAFVARSLGPPCPLGALALGLAGLGHEVHLLLAPTSNREVEEANVDFFASARVIVHRLPENPPRWPLPLLGPMLARRARREAIARVLRSINPRVVHLADADGRLLAVPPGAIVLRDTADVPPTPGTDATVLPDGRLLDRSGLPVPSPGTPPIPAGSPVDDGLDPIASASHWRVLTYLSSIDQLRRDRRVRLDRPHRAPRSPRLARHRAPLAAGLGRT